VGRVLDGVDDDAVDRGGDRGADDLGAYPVGSVGLDRERQLHGGDLRRAVDEDRAREVAVAAAGVAVADDPDVGVALVLDAERPARLGVAACTRGQRGRGELERVVGPVGAVERPADRPVAGAAVEEEPAVAQPPVAGGGVAVDDLAHQRLGLVAGERERAAVVADAEVAGAPAQDVVVDEHHAPELVGDAQRVLLDLPVGEQVVVRVHVGEAGVDDLAVAVDRRLVRRGRPEDAARELAALEERAPARARRGHARPRGGGGAAGDHPGRGERPSQGAAETQERLSAEGAVGHGSSSARVGCRGACRAGQARPGLGAGRRRWWLRTAWAVRSSSSVVRATLAWLTARYSSSTTVSSENRAASGPSRNVVSSVTVTSTWSAARARVDSAPPVTAAVRAPRSAAVRSISTVSTVSPVKETAIATSPGSSRAAPVRPSWTSVNDQVGTPMRCSR